MKFLKKYDQYKNKYLISEGTIKSLIPIIQRNLFDFKYGCGKQYSDLSPEDQQQLNDDIKYFAEKIENKITSITSNKQYQSWIYDILAQQDKDIDEDFEVIEQCIKQFEKICKRPDVKPTEKNIQNYKHFQNLQQFVLTFYNTHNLGNDIFNCFEKLYENNSYILYLIKNNQYEDCNRLFGGKEYFNTGWCVTKNERYFVEYLADEPDKYNGYIVWINKSDNKPFALLHYGSYQFKDTSDEPIVNYTKDIIDGLLHLDDQLNAYYEGDFRPNQINIAKQLHVGKDIGFLIAQIKGYEYDEKTKTLDCLGQSFFMKNSYLDENGTFDFNIVNATSDWSGMFECCEKLKTLPPNFKIDPQVVDIQWMFYKSGLEHLNDSFEIPETIRQCRSLFEQCVNLKSLPESFTIPNTMKHTNQMFKDCINLQYLPENFKLSDQALEAVSMFQGCVNLSKIPDNFVLPKTMRNCSNMFAHCSKLKSLPKLFKQSLAYLIRHKDWFFSDKMFLHCNPLIALNKK